MIISSEITGKTYDTVDECLAAEKEWQRQKEEEALARKAKKEELEKAYKEAIEACERYLKLSGVDIKIDDDDRSYTIKKGNISEDIDDWIDSIMHIF